MSNAKQAIADAAIPSVCVYLFIRMRMRNHKMRFTERNKRKNHIYSHIFVA